MNSQTHTPTPPKAASVGHSYVAIPNGVAAPAPSDAPDLAAALRIVARFAHLLDHEDSDAINFAANRCESDPLRHAFALVADKLPSLEKKFNEALDEHLASLREEVAHLEESASGGQSA